MTIEIYTDGSCKGNPGPGGWGWIKMENGEVVDSSGGGEKVTTNNRMELLAVIEAIRKFGPLNLPLKIISDSKYVVGNVSSLSVWESRGWKGADRKPIKNPDLWQDLYGLCKQFPVSFKWVKGHSGNVGNEFADSVATKYAEEFSK